MQNYFNYFTEIEERFQQRRGSLLMLSTLDWALIEMWREAGVPLEAVLRGIDDAFDRHDARTRSAKARVRRINGLAWVSQSVMEAMEAMQAADARPEQAHAVKVSSPESGFESDRISRFLMNNAEKLALAKIPLPAAERSAEIAGRLRELAEQVEGSSGRTLEDVDRTLTLLEERLLHALMTACTEEELAILRTEASRELAPYRGKMQAVQIRQVQEQFVEKRLLERYGLPRLSLFYMSHR